MKYFNRLVILIGAMLVSLMIGGALAIFYPLDITESEPLPMARMIGYGFVEYGEFGDQPEYQTLGSVNDTDRYGRLDVRIGGTTPVEYVTMAHCRYTQEAVMILDRRPEEYRSFVICLRVIQNEDGTFRQPRINE